MERDTGIIPGLMREILKYILWICKMFFLELAREAKGTEKNLRKSREITMETSTSNALRLALNVGVLANGCTQHSNGTEDTKVLDLDVNTQAEQTPLEIAQSILTEFHPFPKLPTELRLKIWKLATLHPRMIGLEMVPNARAIEFYKTMHLPDHRDDEIHRTLQACPNSRIPALLQVNREAYAECHKLYEIRKLERSKTSYYYDPRVDIIHFGGRDRCLIALCQVFRDQKIPRLALDISSPGATCCQRIRGDYAKSIMRYLHGFRSGPPDNFKRSFYCEGLKEVFFVVKSKPWQLQPSEIDGSVTFLPTDSNGSTIEEIQLKLDLEDYVAKVDKEDLDWHGGNAWVGDEKPAFSFVDFEGVGAPGTLIVSQSDANRLKAYKLEFLKRLTARTGCEIILPDKVFLDEIRREIGIRGEKPEVEKCRKAIEEEIEGLKEL